MAIDNKVDIMAGGYDPRMRPPPGHSLTTPPGNAKYEQPPKFSTSEQFIEHTMERLSIPDIEEELMSSLAMGVSIQEVTNGIGIASFSEGLANPDVVENSKPEIFINILSKAMDFFDVGKDDPLPFKLFPTESGGMEKRENLSDMDRLSTAKELNPVAAQAYDDSRKMQDEARAREMVAEMSMELNEYRSAKDKQNSFLNVEEE
tara:strand:+ start:1665 stop:2276 length:612 start_codon:yes stop_codon:yes gene_type:complete